MQLIELSPTEMYGINSAFKAMTAAATSSSDTSRPLHEARNIMVSVWILCVSIAFFLFINAWSIRFIRQRIRDQEAASADPERAGLPTRGLMIGSLRTQGHPGPSQLVYQLQPLSSPSTPHISPPEQPTGVPGDSSNDTGGNDGRHFVSAGNMASFSFTPDDTEEQLPKYMGRDHNLPDYEDQSERPAE
ncbi:hypothetical protein V490_03869 [Pseudogymnoascus sp. VKM F-3557]|nr:hypothetical protein V490_03869 [Pseudogymnoascus sp. VKM F-3557]